MTVRAVLFDLLMAVMDSLEVWSVAAGGRDPGLRWRDEVTRRMSAAGAYTPYDELVADAAGELRLPTSAAAELRRRWPNMDPWPDSAALARLPLPYAFVTNCSAELAAVAAQRSGLQPRFVLSAEEAGWYKPHPAIYREGCERIEAKPGEVRFVAGSPYDALGALDAGLQAAFVRRRPDHRSPDAAITVLASLDDLVT